MVALLDEVLEEGAASNEEQTPEFSQWVLQIADAPLETELLPVTAG